MNTLFDSAWRAALYCAHPRVIFLSLLPLLLIAGVALGGWFFFWQGAVDAVNAFLQPWAWFDTLSRWLDGMGMPWLAHKLAPLVVILLAMPLIVVLCLLFVAAFMAPSMVTLVVQRRFSQLERKRGGSFAGSAWINMSSTVLALAALIVSIPFWLIPPVVLVVPPLIWGWLTYRVFTYDTLAEHASKEERRDIVKRHRASLLFIGLVTGYLGAAPSLLWVSGALTILLAPLLIPLAIWIYTLVFAFSTLWFAHFALNALALMRAEAASLAAVLPVAAEPGVALSPGAIPPA